jgi:hypothetical protein
MVNATSINESCDFIFLLYTVCEIAQQLVREQKVYSQKTLRIYTQYGYVFYDFDGTTGFDLFSRLNGMDKQFIGKLAKGIIKGE